MWLLPIIWIQEYWSTAAGVLWVCGVSSEHGSADGKIIKSLYINAGPRTHQCCPLDQVCFIMQKPRSCLRVHGTVNSCTTKQRKKGKANAKYSLALLWRVKCISTPPCPQRKLPCSLISLRKSNNLALVFKIFYYMTAHISCPLCLCSLFIPVVKIRSFGGCVSSYSKGPCKSVWMLKLHLLIISYSFCIVVTAPCCTYGLWSNCGKAV